MRWGARGLLVVPVLLGGGKRSPTRSPDAALTLESSRELPGGSVELNNLLGSYS